MIISQMVVLKLLTGAGEAVVVVADDRGSTVFSYDQARLKKQIMDDDDDIIVALAAAFIEIMD